MAVGASPVPQDQWLSRLTVNLNHHTRGNAGDDGEAPSAFVLRLKRKQCGSRLTSGIGHAPEFGPVCGYRSIIRN